MSRAKELLDINEDRRKDVEEVVKKHLKDFRVMAAYNAAKNMSEDPDTGTIFDMLFVGVAKPYKKYTVDDVIDEMYFLIDELEDVINNPIRYGLTEPKVVKDLAKVLDIEL
jgi:hypothetical protein